MTLKTPLLLLAGLLLVAAPARAEPARAADDLREIKKTFDEIVAKRGEPSMRKQEIERVAAFDTKDGAKVLVKGLTALAVRMDEDAGDFAKLLEEYEEVNTHLDVMGDDYKTRDEFQAKIAEKETEQRDDRYVLDAFRAVVERWKSTQALKELGTGARKAKDWRIQEVLGEGLGRNPEPVAVDGALRLFKEDDGRVRAAVLRGLVGKQEDRVFDLAVEALEDEDWPVRREACAVLEGVAEPRVVPPLITALAAEDGRLRDDIRDILRRLTSQNFDDDPEEWKRWFVQHMAELEHDGKGEAMFGAFKSKGSKEQKGVYGIQTRSRHILFIIDTSGSMKNPLSTEKPPTGTPTGLDLLEEDERGKTKIDIAKRELKRAIRALEEEASFNIISYASHVIRWKKQLLEADWDTKNEAMMFVNDMQATGGTWTYGALQEAFKMAGMGVNDKRYEPTIDTIYLISDGAPTDNDMLKPKFMEKDVILEAVREWNRLGKIVIHCVAIDTKAAGGSFIQFMKQLAVENGGQYTQRD